MRPLAEQVRVTEQATGLGFPSGHAMSAALVFGTLAYLAMGGIAHITLRRAVVGVCLALILLTGYGRVYVGAHWPSDVLGGWLWGGTLLWLLITLLRRAERWRERVPGGFGASRARAIRPTDRREPTP
jgi:undecaprenyl-diphosphatase